MSRESIQIFTNFKMFKAFLGPRVIQYMLVGVGLGLVMSFVEFAFAFGLQEFLSVTGIIPKSTRPLLPGFQFDLVGALSFIFILGAVRSLVHWCQFYFSQAIIEVFIFEQRVRLLNWAFSTTSAGAGNVTSIFTEMISNAAYFLGAVQGLFILIPLALFLFVSLIYLAWAPTVVASACLLLAHLIIRRINSYTVSTSHKMYSSYQLGMNQLFRGIKNLILLSIYGTQDKEVSEIIGHFQEAKNQKLFSFKLAALKFSFPQFVGIAIICLLALVITKYQLMDSVFLVSYFYLFVRFVQMVSEASKTGSQLIFSRPHTSGLIQWWLKHPTDTSLVKKVKRGPLDCFPSSIGWQIDRVNFFYEGSNATVLRDISFEIQPGEIFAITGPSGIGKSTLISLLLGEAKPTTGKISLVDGSGVCYDLNEFREKLLSSVGYVGPESFLIEGTIYENIVYGLYEKVEEKEVRRALEQAMCQFVYDQPEQLHFKLTEQGAGLSAGQKQRLALARALLRKPKALFLDEATANLDVDTELRIVETLSSLKGQMTIVIVTHRQGMLKIADHHLDLGLLQQKNFGSDRGSVLLT